MSAVDMRYVFGVKGEGFVMVVTNETTEDFKKKAAITNRVLGQANAYNIPHDREKVVGFDGHTVIALAGRCPMPRAVCAFLPTSLMISMWQ